MIVDLARLKILRPALFRTTVGQLGYTGDPFMLVLGVREIRDGELDPDLAARLQVWISTEKPAAPVVEEPAEEQIDMGALLKEEQVDMKRRADETAAKQRLNEYAEVGLEDTQANAKLIQDFVNNSAVKGWWSREIVDAAVANLGPKGTNQLTWKPKEAPAPPPEPAEPAELLSTLPDGTKQLPLDVDNATLRRASKDQARDWLARTNAGKLIRPKGGFSSSIF